MDVKNKVIEIQENIAHLTAPNGTPYVLVESYTIRTYKDITCLDEGAYDAEYKMSLEDAHKFLWDAELHNNHIFGELSAVWSVFQGVF